MIAKNIARGLGQALTFADVAKDEMSIKDGQINVTLTIKNFVMRDTDIEGRKNVMFNFMLDGTLYSGNFVVDGAKMDDDSTLDRIMNQLTAYIARVIMIEIMAKRIMGNKNNKFDGNPSAA